MNKIYTISKVGWHTLAPRNYEFDKQLYYKSFRNFIHFLQTNGLTTKTILSSDTLVNDDTAIMSSDLTEEGFLLYKNRYAKWIDNIMDKGKSPDDLTVLEKELKKIRSQP